MTSESVVAAKSLTSGRLRFIEFFAGIGGFAACCHSHEIAAAIDIDQAARKVYQQNFSHPYFNMSIESIPLDWLVSFNANAWWLSPPCQPFSRRGVQRDRSDPRCQGLEHLFQLLPQLRPEWLLLENVIGFGESEMFAFGQQQLREAGYQWASIAICPSQWGWPNRRPRFYLLATTGELPNWQMPPQFHLLWPDLLADHAETELCVAAEFIDKYRDSLDRLTLARANDPSACFGSSYGVVSSGAGSYVEYKPGFYRRFSPREILNLLGFPQGFSLDASIPLRKQWKLVGNSLSLPVVKYLIAHLPCWGDGKC